LLEPVSQQYFSLKKNPPAVLSASQISPSKQTVITASCGLFVQLYITCFPWNFLSQEILLIGN
jgi:hypothetical protein